MTFWFLKVIKKVTFFLQESNEGWWQQWDGWTGVGWEGTQLGKQLLLQSGIV